VESTCFIYHVYSVVKYTYIPQTVHVIGYVFLLDFLLNYVSKAAYTHALHCETLDTSIQAFTA